MAQTEQERGYVLMSQHFLEALQFQKQPQLLQSGIDLGVFQTTDSFLLFLKNFFECKLN